MQQQTTTTTIASLFSRLIKFVKNIFHLILRYRMLLCPMYFGFTLDREIIMECNLIFFFSWICLYVCVLESFQLCVFGAENEQTEAIRLQIKLLMNHNGRR